MSWACTMFEKTFLNVRLIAIKGKSDPALRLGHKCPIERSVNSQTHEW